jgi:hypothetical protein
VTNYLTIDPGNAPVLTDNFAPVETLLDPMTGQPLNNDQISSLIAQETLRAAGVVLVILAVVVVLAKKKSFQALLLKT